MVPMDPGPTTKHFLHVLFRAFWEEEVQEEGQEGEEQKEEEKGPNAFQLEASMIDIHVKLWTAGGYWTSFHGGFQSMGYPQPSSADGIFHEILIIQLVRVTQTDHLQAWGSHFSVSPMLFLPFDHFTERKTTRRNRL